MKKFLTTTLVASFLFISITAPAHAATRAELLEKIEILTQLLTLLKARAELQQNPQTLSDESQLDPDLFAVNLSNGDYYNYQGVTGTYHGDRVGLGWRNDTVQTCQVEDSTGLISVSAYYGSETTAQLELIMPSDVEPQIFDLNVSCTIAGQQVTEVFRLSHMWALQNQAKHDSAAIRRNSPTQEWYDQTLSPAETTGLATLKVQHLHGDVYELYGTITPTSNCEAGYVSFFRLNEGTGLHWFLTTPDCTQTQYSESFVYRPIEGVGIGQFSPTIDLITFDGRAITNRVQQRVNFEIDGSGAITYR